MADFVERRISQQAELAVLREKITRIEEVTDENSRSLRGSGNYAGLIGDVSVLSVNMKSLLLTMEEVREAVKTIEGRNLCDTCGVDDVKKDVSEMKEYRSSFPNVLWLLRYRPKETIPIIIVVVVLISLIGHLEIEPLFIILMSGVGVSPAIISAITKAFGK